MVGEGSCTRVQVRAVPTFFQYLSLFAISLKNIGHLVMCLICNGASLSFGHLEWKLCGGHDLPGDSLFD